MPAPTNERQSLEQERAALTGQIAVYRQELENESPRRARRAWLAWTIENVERRLTAIETG